MNSTPIKIRGEWWIIKHSDPIWSSDDITYGETLHDQKIINIYDKTHRTKAAEIETYLHEILHAALPDVGEDAIRSAAIAQTGALVALGFIGKEEEEEREEND
tara:strand:+ start:69 stop:377 length:309 start_codon:yes stop_codon:yes gene_type:complete